VSLWTSTFRISLTGRDGRRVDGLDTVIGRTEVERLRAGGVNRFELRFPDEPRPAEVHGFRVCNPAGTAILEGPLDVSRTLPTHVASFFASGQLLGEEDFCA
jgi:hypothetical protein